ncbi:MAG: L,D-transpeptidase family protein [Xanthobacteraceae bacterium]
MLVTLSAPVSVPAFGQTCPQPLRDARRLVLVTAKTMTTPAAAMQLFERASAADAWRPLGPAEPAVLGRTGMAWGYGFHQLGQDGEPRKVEGDKRTPAGLYRIGQSFGFSPSSQPGYIRLTDGAVCVDDPASLAYNTITSRAVVGHKVHAENMRSNPRYRRGLVVDYPTNAKTRAGSCIFIHVWRSAIFPTAGCVALPEARVAALQEFAAPGAVLATLPQAALSRLPDCLPQIADGKP